MPLTSMPPRLSVCVRDAGSTVAGSDGWMYKFTLTSKLYSGEWQVGGVVGSRWVGWKEGRGRLAAGREGVKRIVEKQEGEGRWRINYKVCITFP